ncbi:hypothetical protein ACHQM5_006144 [Ranunculus cassubicifolius]
MSNTSSTATIQTTPAATTPLQSIHVHHLISVKLDTNNYLIWLTQFKPLLKGYDLEGYVDGTLKCPPRILPAPAVATTGDEAASDGAAAGDEAASDGTAAQLKINPDYATWQKQDQILLGWLLSSLSETVLAQVVGLNTSRDVWVALERHYSSKSKSRILHLRRELHNLKKGSKTMQQYFLQAKQIADNLAASGNKLSDVDLQYTILTGLDSSYDSVVTSLTANISDMSLEEFYSHLLSFEMRLEDQNAIPHSTPMANVAHKNNNYSHPNNSTNNSGRQYHRGSSSRQSNYPNRGPNKPMPAPRSTSEGPCQLCGRKNHSVFKCWYRFDRSFYPHVETPKAFVAAPGSLSDSNWIPDSGATHHLTADLNNLQLQSPYTGPDTIRVGNGNNLSISHTGRSTFQVGTRHYVMNNLFHVPSISSNLLSVSQFCKDNSVYFEFHPLFFVVKEQATGKVLLHGQNKDGLYRFNPPSQQVPSAFQAQSLSLWHHRLGHPMMKTVNKVVSSYSLPVDNKTVTHCEACHISKSHKLPFNSSSTVYDEPLQLVVSDLWGPSPYLSRNGFRYYLLFVDAFSKYTWIYPLAHKNDAFQTFVSFKSQIENLTGKKIKIFQTDNGTEYKKFTPFLTSAGVIHRFSCPHTSAQNGLAERRHRHIVETGLSLLNQASMPLRFWSEAFVTSCYLINRLPSSLSDQTPLELLFRKTPDYSSLKVFGCLCYPYLRPYASNKLTPRSNPCVFIGYCSVQKGYMCLDHKSNRLFISRHVRFVETVFPYSSGVQGSTVTEARLFNTPNVSTSPLSTIHSFPHSQTGPVNSPISNTNPVPTHLPTHPTQSSPSTQITTPNPPTVNTNTTPSLQTEPTLPSPNTSPQEPTVNISSEPIFPVPAHTEPTIPAESITQPAAPVVASREIITRAKSGISKPVNRLCLTASKHPLESTTVLDPSCYSQASQSSEWRQAR